MQLTVPHHLLYGQHSRRPITKKKSHITMALFYLTNHIQLFNQYSLTPVIKHFKSLAQYTG